MHAQLDALLTAIYVLTDDFLPPRCGAGRPPKITDSELITLAIAQVFMGLPNDRQFLALAAYRLAHLFPTRTATRALRHLPRSSERSTTCLHLAGVVRWRAPRLTPVPAGLANRASLVAARRHARRATPHRPLYLLCAADAPHPPPPEREVAREMLERVPLAGHLLIADKGFAGQEFERWIADRGATFLRPDRKDEEPRFGSLGRVRQWIESVFWTCKGQLGLERHGARTLPGLCARVGLRLLALAAGLWHNAEIGQPGRRFAAYGA